MESKGEASHNSFKKPAMNFTVTGTRSARNSTSRRRRGTRSSRKNARSDEAQASITTKAIDSCVDGRECDLDEDVMYETIAANTVNISTDNTMTRTSESRGENFAKGIAYARDTYIIHYKDVGTCTF